MSYGGRSSVYNYGYLYKFFKDKNALSEENAVPLSEEDYLELGYPNGFGLLLWSFFGFIRTFPIIKTDNGKYWFSVDVYKNHLVNSMIIAFLIMFFFVGLILVIPLMILAMSAIYRGY